MYRQNYSEVFTEMQSVNKNIVFTMYKQKGLETKHLSSVLLSLMKGIYSRHILNSSVIEKAADAIVQVSRILSPA